MQTPSLDALADKLAISVLTSAGRVAAVAGVAQTEKVVAAMPLSVAAILTVPSCTAGKTLDLKIQGRRLSTDAWVDLATFTQVTNANFTTPQRVNLPSYPRYRTFDTVAGSAFNGTTDVVAYDVVLVGTDCANAANGITQS